MDQAAHYHREDFIGTCSTLYEDSEQVLQDLSLSCGGPEAKRALFRPFRPTGLPPSTGQSVLHLGEKLTDALDKSLSSIDDGTKAKEGRCTVAWIPALNRPVACSCQRTCHSPTTGAVVSITMADPAVCKKEFPRVLCG